MFKRASFSPIIATVGTLSITLGAWSSFASGHFRWQTTLAAMVLWCVVGWLGACIWAGLARSGERIDPIVGSTVGYFATSVILFFGTVLLHWSIVTSLLACMAVLAVLVYATRRRSPLERLKLEIPDFATLLVAIGLTTLWSQQNLRGLITTPTTVTSTPWFDALYHSVQVMHFASGSGAHLGIDPLLATARLSPYHYAGYMVPSLMQRVAGDSAYVATVAHFAPVGTLFTGLAAYAFGRHFAGSWGGLLATMTCLALPDPSFYLVENRWLSYFFFQQIAGNGAFGSALMAISWLLCIRGSSNQSTKFTLAGLTTGLLVVLFKSQIFLAYSLGLALFAAGRFPKWSRLGRVLLVALVSAAFLTAIFVVLPAIPHAPTFHPGTTAGPTNLHFALSNLGGACQACVLELSKHYTVFLAIAIPALLILIFGPLPALLLGLANSRRVRVSLLPEVRWFPWIVLANFLLVALGLELNAEYGDPFEVVHKTFVWPYLALGIWCGCALAVLVRAMSWVPRRLVLTIVLPLALAGLGYWSYGCANQLQTGFVYVGSETGSRITITRDAYDTALFIRANTARDSIVQLGILDNMLFPAVAERHAYVYYPRAMRFGPEARFAANDRLAALLAAPTAQTFRDAAHDCHIDYFVLCPGQQPLWASQMQPVFQSGGYRVYRI